MCVVCPILFRYALQKRYQRKAIEILRRAKIVAMTTTGAAIHQQLLSQLEAPVVFVEEAAEILESNLLAVLTPHVKHMVLIGDHKQLKPNVRIECVIRIHSVGCV